MSEQRALDITVEDADIATFILDAHNGDALAAIRSLLLDADFLRDQLWIASSLMSRGIARGWRPQYVRAEQ